MRSRFKFEEYNHNFAVWTTARAIRGGNNDKIEKAISASGIQEFSLSKEIITQIAFDKKHERWCDKIIGNINCTYGVAAKIVAIYFKTTVILPDRSETERCKVIHPPIDSHIIEWLSTNKGLINLKNLKWTKFDKGDYKSLMEQVRHSGNWNGFNYEIEAEWQCQRKLRVKK